MKLFLIRHGQTTGNLKRGTYCGQTDVPLTELGRHQAEQIRPILARHRFDRVFSSDLIRAIDTQRIALPGIEGERTALLREIDVGSLAGRTRAEIVAQYGEDSIKNGDYVAFGGENRRLACDRVRKFLSALEQDPCDNVAVFAHNGILNCVMEIVLKAEFDRSATLSPNCAIHVYEFDGSRWKLLAWNYMAEL